jgi:hypothetical protein
MSRKRYLSYVIDRTLEPDVRCEVMKMPYYLKHPIRCQNAGELVNGHRICKLHQKRGGLLNSIPQGIRGLLW